MVTLEHMTALDKWEKVINEAESSGMNIRPWCVKNNIPVSQYYYWHRQLVLEERIPGRLPQVSSNEESFASASVTPVFAEVKLEETAPTSETTVSAMESRLAKSQIMIERNQYKIFIGDDFSTTTLEKVLEVIGNAS